MRRKEEIGWALVFFVVVIALAALIAYIKVDVCMNEGFGFLYCILR